MSLKANRRGGPGRGLSKKSALHPTTNIAVDLMESADRTVAQNYLAVMPAVVAGIEPAWYSPKEGGFVKAEDAASHLLRIGSDPGRKIRTWHGVNQKPGAMPKRYEVSSALQHFHASLRSDLLIALWLGEKQRLPSVAGLMKELMVEAASLVQKKYDVEVTMVCLHPPSPYLEEAMERAGWVSATNMDDSEEKKGFWNLHFQIYVSRLRDGQWIFPASQQNRVFVTTSDSTMAVLHLAQLGVDVEAHAYSARAGQLRRSLEAYQLTGGQSGRELPKQYSRLVANGKLSASAAIDQTVSDEILRWKAAWTSSKSGGLAEKNRLTCEELQVSRAPGFHLSQWLNRQIADRLPDLDKRYDDLLSESKQVFCELKKEQIAGGHAELLNDIFNRWWRRRQEESRRREDEKRQRELEETVDRLGGAEGRVSELQELVRESERARELSSNRLAEKDGELSRAEIELARLKGLLEGANREVMKLNDRLSQSTFDPADRRRINDLESILASLSLAAKTTEDEYAEMARKNAENETALRDANAVLEKQRLEERRNVGKIANWAAKIWLDGLRDVMAGLPPPKSMKRFFADHESGRLALVGGVGAAERAIEFNPRNEAAIEFLRIHGIRSAALREYSLLKAEKGNLEAEAFLAAKEREWAAEYKPAAAPLRPDPLQIVCREVVKEYGRALKGELIEPRYVLRDDSVLGRYVIRPEIVAMAGLLGDQSTDPFKLSSSTTIKRHELHEFHRFLEERNAGSDAGDSSRYFSPSGELLVKWSLALRLAQEAPLWPSLKECSPEVRSALDQDAEWATACDRELKKMEKPQQVTNQEKRLGMENSR